MSHDVVVIGGGPAGSTAAALLAREGARVLVLEQARFPRFHIGESLLPCDLPVFARLGLDLGGLPFLRKQGAEIHDEARGDRSVFSFADGLPGTPDHAYQVERGPFDHLLLRLAADAGAEVHEEEKVTDVDLERARVTTDRGSYDARFVLDATGQQALLARRLRTLEPTRQFGRAAVFCHFEGVSDEVWQTDVLPAGNIKILMQEDGWAWCIPLVGQRLSVGFVRARGRVSEATLDEGLAASPLTRRLTAGARRGPTHLIGDFSYRNTRPAGPRWACIGDAACFIDPMFSTGVSLGMLNAMHAADVLAPALREGREADPDLMTSVAARMERPYRTFTALVHRFYNTRMVRNLFFASETEEVLRRGFISVIAGDVWREDNPFQRALLAPARARG
ncbi:MAG: tryptophan 7-halogenase [Planctomycetes bacterium]|nr:tryptophan 7-halogenase [Planctomycetota bacterium]